MRTLKGYNFDDRDVEIIRARARFIRTDSVLAASPASAVEMAVFEWVNNYFPTGEGFHFPGKKSTGWDGTPTSPSGRLPDKFGWKPGPK